MPRGCKQGWNLETSFDSSLHGVAYACLIGMCTQMNTFVYTHTNTNHPCLLHIQTHRPCLHTPAHDFTLSGSQINTYFRILHKAMSSWSIGGLSRHLFHLKSNLAQNHLRPASFVSEVLSTHRNRCHIHFSINYFPHSSPLYKFIIYKENIKLYLFVHYLNSILNMGQCRHIFLLLYHFWAPVANN